MKKSEYKKYEGVEVRCNGSKGVVCGYSPLDEDNGKDDLIMAVTDGCYGWEESIFNNEIVTHKNNPLGYWWVDSCGLNPNKA